MSESHPKSIARSRPWLPAAKATILLLLAAATAVRGQDAPQNAGSCSFRTKPLAVVRATEANGFDLEVTVDWSHDAPLPAMAEIVLYDGDGNLLMGETTPPVAGQRTVKVMPGALSNAFTLGFQYYLEIIDLMGNPMSSGHHFRVFVDCPGAGPCTLRTVDHLQAGSMVIDRELMLFLDDLEGLGSTDLLGDALIARPSLRGEILTLAEQLSDLDRESTLEGCVCAWVPAFDLSPKREISHDPVTPSTPPPYPDFETGGSSGPGALFGAGLQAVRGPLQQLVLGGLTHLTMDLRCWAFGEWRPESFDLETSAKAMIETRVPVVGPCEEACDAEVRSQSDLEGKLEAESYGTLDDGSDVLADLDVLHYVVDRNFQNHKLFDNYSLAEVDAEAQGATADLLCTHKAADQTLPGSRASAVMKTAATLTVEPSLEAYGVAVANVDFWMKLTGEAACAVEPTAEVFFGIDDEIKRDDGLEMEHWGHPR